MGSPRTVVRSWLQEILPDEVRLRVSYRRRGKRIVRYLVQIEIHYQDTWRPVVRYDNAHGFCHRDTVHFDGTQDKTPTFVGSPNDTFTLAIEKRPRRTGKVRDYGFCGKPKHD